MYNNFQVLSSLCLLKGITGKLKIEKSGYQVESALQIFFPLNNECHEKHEIVHHFCHTNAFFFRAFCVFRCSLIFYFKSRVLFDFPCVMIATLMQHKLCNNAFIIFYKRDLCIDYSIIEFFRGFRKYFGFLLTGRLGEQAVVFL